MSDATELIVNLCPAALNALERAANVTGDTRTDTVNRALQVYDLLVMEKETGARILLARDRRWWRSEVSEVTFL